MEGGIKSNLRIEQTAESRILDISKFSGAEAVGNFGQRVLHFADDLADDKDGMGIQNAWADSVVQAKW